MLNKIKADSLTARKEKNALASVLLTTLYSEAANVGKNAGNRETTDAEVVAVVKKFLKGVDDTISYLEKTGGDTAVALNTARGEKAILEQYLPKQLTELELRDITGTILLTVEKTPKSMGKILGIIKDKYAGQYDGALASRIVKEALA